MIDEQKGADDLLAAFERLAKAMPPLTAGQRMAGKPLIFLWMLMWEAQQPLLLQAIGKSRDLKFRDAVLQQSRRLRKALDIALEIYGEPQDDDTVGG